MTNIAQKQRSGDENIGRLIVFAITIIIAVGVLGILSYFYTQNKESAVDMSVLGSENSSSQDILDAEFCDDSTFTTGASIDFNAISDEYTIKCEGGGTQNLGNVGGITITSGSVGDTSIGYEINN